MITNLISIKRNYVTGAPFLFEEQWTPQGIESLEEERRLIEVATLSRKKIFVHAGLPVYSSRLENGNQLIWCHDTKDNRIGFLSTINSYPKPLIDLPASRLPVPKELLRPIKVQSDVSYNTGYEERLRGLASKVYQSLLVSSKWCLATDNFQSEPAYKSWRRNIIVLIETQATAVIYGVAFSDKTVRSIVDLSMLDFSRAKHVDIFKSSGLWGREQLHLNKRLIVTLT